MVIKLLHADITEAAVLGAYGAHSSACVADIEDGVVVVSVVTPRSRVSNLDRDIIFTT